MLQVPLCNSYIFLSRLIYIRKSVGTIPLPTRTFRPSHCHSFQISNAESPRRYVYKNYVQHKLYAKRYAYHVDVFVALFSERRFKVAKFESPKNKRRKRLLKYIASRPPLQEAFCTGFCKVTKLMDSHKEISQLFPVAVS